MSSIVKDHYKKSIFGHNYRTVSTNCHLPLQLWYCFAMLCDWPVNLPIRSKTWNKNNRELLVGVFRARRRRHTFALSSHWLMRFQLCPWLNRIITLDFDIKRFHVTSRPPLALVVYQNNKTPAILVPWLSKVSFLRGRPFNSWGGGGGGGWF